MSEPTKAVFLSYARDDAAVARRIAEALRASGLEVWFDENELRGGDTWDAKIRRQIDDCTLFIPVISTHTQERSKGYFRLEWKLAVDQTHLLAAGVPFIAPVVIDDTRENQAVVPPEFMRVQWMRLPGALPTPEFVGQVKRLLSKEPGSSFAKASEDRAGGKEQGKTQRPEVGAAPRKSGPPGWTWGAGTAVVVGIAVALFSTHKPQPATPAPPSPSPSASLSPSTPPPAAAAKSIAVLPFANFSPDKENEFFTDGMHDEVITALAKIHDLTVISRTSVLAYKSPEGRNLKKIAAELGVATVLEGSVQRAGNRVKVIVQLIDARTDQHLWAETYTEDVTDVFTIQAKLAGAITSALKATLSPEEHSLIARRPTDNQEAYDLYLRALILDQKLTAFTPQPEFEKVLSLYAQAAAKDPAFVLPHVRMAILHGTMYWFAALDATPERQALALAEVEVARHLAPSAPETRLAEGLFEYTCRNDWNRALQHYRAAEADLPNDAQLHYRAGLALRRLGRLVEALEQFEQAVALNPNDNNTDTTLVETNLALRRYPRVIELVERYLALFPGDAKLTRFRALARYELDGDRPAFLRELHASVGVPDSFNGKSLAYHDALNTGDLAGAERILEASQLTVVLNVDGTISDPVALHHSLLACLQDRPEEARRWADEAIAAYRKGHWVYRQEPWAQMGIARAEFYAGRTEEGIRDAKAALDEELKRDAFSSRAMRMDYGRLLVLAHRPEEALAELRRIITEPTIVLTCGMIRTDPVWSRLKGDTRFEEILRSSKPL